MIKIECEPCGETLLATDEDELVRMTVPHAAKDHHVTLTRADVLAMAQPA